MILIIIIIIIIDFSTENLNALYNYRLIFTKKISLKCFILI